MSDLTGTDRSRVSRVAERLVAHGETIAISQSSAGGLISAALLSVPGASAYFLGGGVIYTRKAMGALLELTPAKLEGLRSATEPMASLLAETVRSRLNADWGLAETGLYRSRRQPIWRRRTACLPGHLGPTEDQPNFGDGVER